MLQLLKQTMLSEKYARLFRLYCLLLFSLWSVLLRPCLKIEKAWILKDFIWPFKQRNEFIHVEMHATTFLAAVVYTSMALVSFYDICSRSPSLARYRSCRNTMLVKYAPPRFYYKYFWLCVLPWLFVYAMNWLSSVCKLWCKTLHTADVNIKNGLFLTVTVIYLLQALVFKEVFCHMAWGYQQMVDIDARLLQRHHAMQHLIKSNKRVKSVESVYDEVTNEDLYAAYMQHTDGGGDADISGPESPNDCHNNQSDNDEFLRYSVGDGWGFPSQKYVADYEETFF